LGRELQELPEVIGCKPGIAHDSAHGERVEGFCRGIVMIRVPSVMTMGFPWRATRKPIFLSARTASRWLIPEMRGTPKRQLRFRGPLILREARRRLRGIHESRPRCWIELPILYRPATSNPAIQEQRRQTRHHPDEWRPCISWRSLHPYCNSRDTGWPNDWRSADVIRAGEVWGPVERGVRRKFLK